MELGLVNYIINRMELWIHADRVELEVARLVRLDTLRERGRAKDALSAFYADPFNELLPLLSQRDNLEEELDEGEEEQLLQLQYEESQLEDALAAAESAFATAKANERKLAKSFGRLTRPTILRIEEEVYNAWSIRRPSYHGGDFVGPARLSIDNAIG
jgi:hypothetical protein